MRVMTKVRYNPTTNIKSILEYPGLTIGKIYNVITYKKSHISYLYDNIIIIDDNGHLKEYYIRNYGDEDLIFFENAITQFRNEVIDDILK